MSGKKNDQNKPMMSLIPPYAKEELAKAMTYGYKKYGQYNWMGGLTVTRYLSAAERHMTAYLQGEDLDAESGNNHLGHAMASLAMAFETAKFRPDLDDRPNYKGMSLMGDIEKDLEEAKGVDESQIIVYRNVEEITESTKSLDDVLKTKKEDHLKADKESVKRVVKYAMGDDSDS